jgi:hypothetical protein
MEGLITGIVAEVQQRTLQELSKKLSPKFRAKVPFIGLSVELGGERSSKQQQENTTVFKQYCLSSKLNGNELISSNFNGCLFEETELYNSNLTGTKLTDSQFIGSSLVSSNLTNADTTNTLFEDVNLEGTRISKAQLAKARVKNITGTPNWIEDSEEPEPSE